MAMPASDPTSRRDDIEQLKLVMQLRGEGIIDQQVLAAMERVPRSLFVPLSLDRHTRTRRPLPIGRHETISDPFIVARMTEALRIELSMRVLEIGTGSGYQTAILAQLARRIYSIERNGRLLFRAKELIAELGFRGIAFRHGDGALGWAEVAPFHRILVAAASEEPPPVLWQQLAPDGLMVFPLLREDGSAQIMALRKKDGEIGSAELVLNAPFVPLREGFTNI